MHSTGFRASLAKFYHDCFQCLDGRKILVMESFLKSNNSRHLCEQALYTLQVFRHFLCFFKRLHQRYKVQADGLGARPRSQARRAFCWVRTEGELMFMPNLGKLSPENKRGRGASGGAERYWPGLMPGPSDFGRLVPAWVWLLEKILYFQRPPLEMFF